MVLVEHWREQGFLTLKLKQADKHRVMIQRPNGLGSVAVGVIEGRFFFLLISY